MTKETIEKLREEVGHSVGKIVHACYNLGEKKGVTDVIDKEVGALLKLVADQVELAEKRMWEEERQFILNVLEGIDLADESLENKGCGTEAIRFALQSRVFGPTNNSN